MIDRKHLCARIILYHTANLHSEMADQLAWQLLIHWKNIIDSSDKIKNVICVFIDLMKAFVTIDYTILLQKLIHNEIRGIDN